MKGIAQPYEYHQEGDVWTHTMHALKSLPVETSLIVRWATLLHDSGKPETFELKERIRFDHHTEFSTKIAGKILNRLKFPKKFIEEVCWIVQHHMMMVSLVDMPQGRKMHWFLHPWFLNLMQVFKADAEGAIPVDLKLYEQILKLYRESVTKMPKEPKPLLSGADVIKKLKIKPGPLVGEILSQLRHKQLGEEITTKKEALSWLNKFEQPQERQKK